MSGILSDVSVATGRRLYPKNEAPALPGRNSLYGAAKRLEFEGDLRGAFSLYHQAIYYGDRTDSALKDISNIYVMFGRVKEAIEFLRANECYVTNRKGYENLITRLTMELKHQEEDDYIMPRVLLVEVVDYARLGSLTLDLCDRLFPNPAKIRRMLYIDGDGLKGLLHFSTYSSARKALQVRKECDSSVRVSWAAAADQALMLDIESKELAEDPVCLFSRRLQRLPEHLAAFDDDRSCVGVYHLSDPIVLSSSERVAALESSADSSATPSDAQPEACTQM
jgi:hypothetical protein